MSRRNQLHGPWPSLLAAGIAVGAVAYYFSRGLPPVGAALVAIGAVLALVGPLAVYSLHLAREYRRLPSSTTEALEDATAYLISRGMSREEAYDHIKALLAATTIEEMPKGWRP